MIGQKFRDMVPSDADLSYIAADLRALAVPVASLAMDPRNARKHLEQNLQAIKGSLAKYGQRKPLVANLHTGAPVIEAGNGTLEALAALGREYVAVSFHDDDAITATGYGLADNRTAEIAEWDDEVLAGLIADLQTEGEDLSAIGFDDAFLADILEQASSDDVHSDAATNSDDNAAGDNLYTKKIEAPIYEPKNVKPSIRDLFNSDRCAGLVAEIQQSNIPDDEKEFLIAAARRHVVFNYHNIADYYAHSSPAVQRLMENSALVIIDFNKAIELGYAHVSEEIANQFREEYPDVG